MIIKNFEPYEGQHCETTTIGALLGSIGLTLSEPLLFGLGEGLGFVVWNAKNMGYPFIGGRIRQDVITTNCCRNLNLDLQVQETTSVTKAWKNVQEKIERGIPVGLKLDCYHLEYFGTKIHFAGHYVAMYGYDDELAYLNDTHQQGLTVKTSLASLALARNERGAMSSRNRSFTITKKQDRPDLKRVLLQAIRSNAADFLHPPIKNLGYLGIAKTAHELPKWYEASQNREADFTTVGRLMERGGTGGALFRNLYRDFLSEAGNLLGNETLLQVSTAYASIAQHWTRVSDLLVQIGFSGNKIYLKEATELLLELAQLEQQAMTKLYQATEKR